MKKVLFGILILVCVCSVAVDASVIRNWGPYITAKATVEATRGILYSDGSLGTTAIGTTAATSLSTTTLSVDHIGEKTSSHKIVFDNNLNAAGRTWTDLGTVTTAVITNHLGSGEVIYGVVTADAVLATSMKATTFTGALTGAASSNLLKAGGTMTGALTTDAFDANWNDLTNIGTPDANFEAATKLYVDDANALKANIAGPTFTGIVTTAAFDAAFNDLTNVGTPDANFEAATKLYVDGFYPKSGGSMEGGVSWVRYVTAESFSRWGGSQTITVVGTLERYFITVPAGVSVTTETL